jgi:hypothetical protein
VSAAAGLLLAGAAALWWRGSAARSAEGPIIFVSIDTLRADHLPAYGYAKVRTPAIDALAADGVVIERAYAHSPQTLPSHASILSGRLPFETGVRGQRRLRRQTRPGPVAGAACARGLCDGRRRVVAKAKRDRDRARVRFLRRQDAGVGSDRPIGQIERDR